jgi:drug/metabolite transporter (DMT)-like permease
MATILALTAAVLYGSADFLGGAASRRAHALAVLAVSAPLGAVVLLTAALVAGGPPRAAGLGWAAAAGICGGLGLIVFYSGLAAGPMNVVAPVTALVSTLLPVGVALASGERQRPVVYAGGLVCLAAIVLVSAERPASARRAGRRQTARAAGYGVAGGIAFGLFLLFLRYAGQSGVYWPVAASRLTGAAVILAAAAWHGIRPGWRGWQPRVLAATVCAGAFDAAANLCYVLAARAGMFGIAVILTSLYPGVTVVLARVVLGERMRASQRLGLALAAAGVIMVAA